MLCEDLRIDEAVYIGDDGGFWMGLEHLVGVLEFQVVGQGEQVPALMEKGPKVGAVAPANILKDAFIQFKGGIFEVEGEVYQAARMATWMDLSRSSCLDCS